MACLTALSSSCPRRRYTISSFFQTVGGSAARSPEQITSSDSSFCRFFPRMLTMSVAVQAPRAISTSSIGPGPVFEWRSESMLMACPEGLVATNFSSPIHFTDAVCMAPPAERIAGGSERNDLDMLYKPARSSMLAPRRNCRSSGPYDPWQISAYDSKRIRETTEGGDATEKGSNAVERGAHFCVGSGVVDGARTIECEA